MQKIEEVNVGALVFTLYSQNLRFWAIGEEEYTGKCWEFNVFGMDLKTFIRIRECKQLAGKFLQVDKDRKIIVYVNGLSGGGCFGSKIKAEETEKVDKVVIRKIEKNDETSRMPNQAESPKSKSDIENFVEIITKDLQLGVFNKKYLEKLIKSDYLSVPNIQNIFQALFNSLSNTEVFKMPSAYKSQSQYLKILKECLILSLSSDQTELITPNLSSLTALHSYYEQRNQYTPYLEPLIHSSQALNILTSLKTPKFSQFLSKSLSTKTIPNPPEAFLYTKFIFIQLLSAQNKLKPENIEKELKISMKNLKNLNFLEIFEIFQTCYRLINLGLLKNDFLHSEFLNISGLLESQQCLIRQVSVHCLKKLKKCSSLNLAQGIQALVNQIFVQEENFVVKGEICIVKQAKKQANKGIVNVDLKNSTRILARAEELAEIWEGLQEKHFYGIFGESGTGKTALAYYFAKSFRDEYKVLWFVNSEQCELDLLALMEVLKIENKGKDFKGLVEMLTNQNFEGKILLVFDNGENLDQIDKFIIKNPKVHILIVTRTQIWKNSINLNKIDNEIHNIVIQSQYCEPLQQVTLTTLKTVFNTQILYIKLLNLAENKANLDTIESSASINSIIQAIFLEFHSKLSLSNHFLIEILAFLGPNKVPTTLIKPLFLLKYSKNDWKLSKFILQGNSLITVHKKPQAYWSLSTYIYSLFNDCPKSSSTQQILDDSLYSNFVLSQIPGTFNVLTFNTLNYIYQTSLNTMKTLKIGLCLIENLSLINFDKMQIVELLEIFEEKCLELLKNDQKEALKELKVLIRWYDKVGKDLEALRLFMQYQQESEKFQLEHEEICEDLLYGAELADQSGENEYAELLYSQYLEKNSEGIIGKLENIYVKYANLLIRSKNNEKAEIVLKEGLEKSNKNFFSCLLLNTLGQLKYLEKNFEESKKWFINSKSLIEKHSKTETLEYSETLLSLSKLHMKNSEYPEAHENLTKSLKLTSSLLSPTHLDIIYPASQLLKLSKNTNDKKTTEIALNLYKTIKNSLKVDFSLVQNLSELDLSDYYPTISAYKKSENRLKKGLRIFESSDINN